MSVRLARFFSVSRVHEDRLVVAVRIVPAKIARARLGQLEVSAHHGRGDGRVVSAVCGSPPESVTLLSIKEKKKT
jgi:hypothetical protein